MEGGREVGREAYENGVLDGRGREGGEDEGKALTRLLELPSPWQHRHSERHVFAHPNTRFETLTRHSEAVAQRAST